MYIDIILKIDKNIPRASYIVNVQMLMYIFHNEDENDTTVIATQKYIQGLQTNLMLFGLQHV